MGLFTNIWMGLKWLFKLIATPLAKIKPRGGRVVRQVIRWGLHALCVIGILVGLAILNYQLDLEKMLRVPWPLLRKAWLPLLFSLIYILAWLGWWLWHLLRAKPGPSVFPDIDDAWREATEALKHSGIDLTRTPLFMILGRPSGPEACLFNASRVPLMVPQVPRNPDAPLHVFASPDAIYVTCAGASLLGRQAELLAEEEESDGRSDPDHVTAWDDLAETANETPFVPAGSLDSDSAMSASHQQLEEAVALLVDEKEQPRQDAAKPTREEVVFHHSAKLNRRSLLKDARQVQQHTARLQHLCGLIVKDRELYCPLNGVLALIPFGATEGDVEANETAIIIQHDLDAVHQTMRVRCPLLAVVCDLEKAPGGTELLSRFPEDRRSRRLGVRFPHIPDRDAAVIPKMIEDGVRWICHSLIPPLVYRLANVGKQDSTEEQAELRGNVRLCQFLHQMRHRQKRLTRILTRGVCPDGAGPWRLGGCFLAATGPDAVHEQGFAGGIFPQLLEMQNSVAWNEQAIADDASCQRWTKAGYATLALSVAALAALGVLL